MKTKIAVSQQPPTWLNLEATMDCAINIIVQASSQGAKLIVFPETYLPGYPAWVWRLRPGKDMALCNKLHRLLRENSVDIEAGGLARLCDTAREKDVVVVMGLNEIESQYSKSTLFNTVVVINSDGTLLNKHRKLMPTNPERMVHGFGDGSGLQVVDTSVGRIGCLICWENYMPLSRYALYAQGIDIYIAPTWDSGDTWTATMKHIAKEGGCWVIGSGVAMQASDIPEEISERDSIFPDPDEWINTGGSVVVRPFGKEVQEPLVKKKTILYVNIDAVESIHSRKSLDVSGHYGRPDIFTLNVNRTETDPINFWDAAVPGQLPVEVQKESFYIT